MFDSWLPPIPLHIGGRHSTFQRLDPESKGLPVSASERAWLITTVAVLLSHSEPEGPNCPAIDNRDRSLPKALGVRVRKRHVVQGVVRAPHRSTLVQLPG
jgi:hypothetical protein